LHGSDDVGVGDCLGFVVGRSVIVGLGVDVGVGVGRNYLVTIFNSLRVRSLCIYVTIVYSMLISLINRIPPIRMTIAANTMTSSSNAIGSTPST